MNFLPDDTLRHLRSVTEEPDLRHTRYRIDREIGRGGMGVVYRAWDSTLERAVALKVMDDASGGEPKILARLEHPGLVPVYDAGTLPDGRGYYAMRLVEGRRLDEYFSTETSLPARLRIFLRICEAVAFAHDSGVVHRDLKPQNIMIGSFGEVFVMDWGIARRLDHAAEAPPGGTPPYSAPEADPDGRADIYSLGRILQDAVHDTGNRPLAAVIERATAVAPGDRYATVSQLGSDVTHYLDGMAVSAYRESPWEHAARFIRNNHVLLLLIAAFLVVKFAIFFLSRH